MATRRKKAKKRIAEQQKAADEAMEQSRGYFDNLQAPTYEQLMGAAPMNSNVLGISATDPALMAAQRHGLGQMQGAMPYMQQVAQQGFTPQDQAILDAAQRQQNLNERGQRDAIMASARARGMGGSGMEMMNSMIAQQGAANRGADLAAQMGQAAVDRRYGANRDVAALGGQTAGLAGQIDAQRFGQQMGRGQALDAFNWQLAGMDQAARQGAWNNQFGLAGAQSGAAQAAAGYHGQQAQQAQEQLQQMNQSLFNGFMQVAGAVPGLATAFKGAGSSTQPQQGWSSGTYRGTPGGGR